MVQPPRRSHPTSVYVSASSPVQQADAESIPLSHDALRSRYGLLLALCTGVSGCLGHCGRASGALVLADGIWDGDSAC